MRARARAPSLNTFGYESVALERNCCVFSTSSPFCFLHSAPKCSKGPRGKGQKPPNLGPRRSLPLAQETLDANAKAWLVLGVPSMRESELIETTWGPVQSSGAGPMDLAVVLTDPCEPT